MIKKSDLKIGWYLGQGRNANVAYWTGSTFLTIGKKFDQYTIKDEGLYEEGYCFKPLKRIAGSRVEQIDVTKDLTEQMKEANWIADLPDTDKGKVSDLERGIK